MPDGISAGTAYIKFRGNFAQLSSQLAAQLAPTRLNKMGKLGGAALGAGVVVAAGAAAVKLSADFEKAMRNVNSIAQLPEKQFKKLNSQVLDLAGKTAQAPQTLAEGLYDLVSSGFDAKESIDILEKSARAATAGLTDTATSTKVVASVLNAYRQPAAKAGKVSDILFRTVDRGVITFEELASTLGQTTPLAAQLKVPLEEVGAAIATMTKQGLSGAEANTRLRGILVQMVKPTEGLNAAFKELNVESGEDLIKQTGSIQKALVALIGTTDGSKEAVGEMFTNQRALIGALALTGQNAKAAAKDLTGMKDASGATALALSQQSKSLNFQFQKLSASIQALAIRFGTVLLPPITAVVKELNLLLLGKSEISKFFDEILPQGGEGGEAFNDIATAAKDLWIHVFKPLVELQLPLIQDQIEGTIQALGGLAKVISGIVTLDPGKVFEGFGDIFKGLGKAVLARLKIAALPFTIAGKFLGKALIGGIRAAFSVVRDVVLAVGGFLRKYTPFGVLIDGVIKLARFLRRLLPKAWDIVKDGIKLVWEFAKRYSMPALMIRGFKALVKFLRGPFGAAWEWIKGAIADAVKFTLRLLGTLLDGIAKVADAGSKMPGPIGDAWDKVQAGAEDARDSINDVTKSLEKVDRHRDRIKNLGKAFKDLDKDTGKSKRDIRDWVKNLDRQMGKGRQITKKEMRLVARYLGRGTKEGGKASDKNMSGFVSAVAEALNVTRKNVKKALDSFGGGLGDFKDYEVQSKKKSSRFVDSTVALQQGGAIVPGGRSGDRNLLQLNGVPIARVEDREGIYVVNRSAQAYLSQVNHRLPRRAQGGGLPTMIQTANQIDAKGFPYVWGGGHGSFSGPYDCSGAVSAVLHSAGLLSAPLVSGALASWGKPGSGPLTVFANAGHTFMSLAGKFFGTSGSNPGGGAGWFPPPGSGYTSGFTRRTLDVGSGVAPSASLPKVTLTGPDGPFKWHGQAGLDMVRKAGSAYIQDHMPGSFGGPGDEAGDWKGVSSVNSFIPYWNMVNPQHRRYASRFGRIVQAESTFNPRAINHIGLGHAGWYQYDPPTWRAYDGGAGDPSWPGGPFQPGLATQHTGSMLDHEGASTFSRWAATDPGAMRGGVIRAARGGLQRLAGGGEVRIPGYDSKHGGSFVFPKYFRRIRKGVKGAVVELGKIIGGLVNDDSEWGLNIENTDQLLGVRRDADLDGELAGIANTLTREVPIAASPTPGPGAPLGFEEGTLTVLGLARGDDEGEWLRRQLDQLYGLRILLLLADEYMADVMKRISKYIRYLNSQLKVREKTLKVLKDRLKPLKRAYGKAKGEHKKILKKRIDWYNDNIKGEQRIIGYIKGDQGLSLLESEEEAGKSGQEGITSTLEGLQGLSGIGGEIFDVQQSLVSFNEMARQLLDREPVDTGESTALHIDELIRFAEAIRLGATLPQFAQGGVVPGAVGSAQPIMAHGQEVVLRPDQAAAMGGTTELYADIYIGGEKVDERVRTELRNVERVSDLKRRAGVAPG